MSYETTKAAAGVKRPTGPGTPAAVEAACRRGITKALCEQMREANALPPAAARYVQRHAEAPK
ncbi:MAG: hypothetical protein ACRDXE_10690 [Acidimicrobiales bacterium]